MHFHSLLTLGLATTAGTGVVLATSPSQPTQHGHTRRDAYFGIDPTTILKTPRDDTAPAPKRFIVELEDGASIASLALALAGVKVIKVFDSEIFRGVAVETDEDNVDSLSALKEVSQAWHSKRIMLDPVQPDTLIPGGDLGQGVKLSRAEDERRNVSLHHMTGVDQLHERGIFGKGVQIAIVDTGVDYTHPALGGAFGPGNKVAGGYDFVGDGYWPEGDKKPDKDPKDLTGHGTHVAGIIAGNDGLLVGVAPEATLMAYKVFSQGPGTDEETLIEAFIRAYEDGADIITSSIGGINGWSNNAWALIASRMVERGVVVTISAGNDGQAGPFSSSTGASGANVVAVASVDGDTIAVPRFIATFENGTSTTTEKLVYRSREVWIPSEVNGWPIHPISLDINVAADACSTLPNNTVDLSRVVALVRRGGCNFSVKQRNLEAKGAKHIVFYSDNTSVVVPGASDPISRSNMSMITKETGERIVQAISGGIKVMANFDLTLRDSMTGLPYEYGGVASSFTSMGATNDLALKPDVAAPGGQIFSSFLNGGYASLSGTSMACPYVAGIAALYISHHGGRKTKGPGFAKDLAMRLISSGQPVPWDDGSMSGKRFEGFAPVNQVGTGLINAVKVLDSTSSLSLARFALNDTRHFERYHKVDVTNGGTAPVTYTFGVRPFSGMETFNRDPAAWATPRISWYEEVMARGPLSMPADVTLPRSFTLQPGESRTAQVDFAPPTGFDASTMPLYGGTVEIKASSGDVMAVPYMGMAADVQREVGLMFTSPTNITTTSRFLPLAVKPNTTLSLDPATADFPEAYVRLQYASAELRWDVYEESYTEREWTYPPVVGQGKFVGSVASYAAAMWQGEFDPQRMSANNTISLPIRYVPRSVSGSFGQAFWWFGQLANGSSIRPGKYRMRLAALLPFGTPQNSDNWDVFDAPVLEILKR